jgi:hypothetical protein
MKYIIKEGLRTLPSTRVPDSEDDVFLEPIKDWLNKNSNEPIEVDFENKIDLHIKFPKSNHSYDTKANLKELAWTLKNLINEEKPNTNNVPYNVKAVANYIKTNLLYDGAYFAAQDDTFDLIISNCAFLV